MPCLDRSSRTCAGHARQDTVSHILPPSHSVGLFASAIPLPMFPHPRPLPSSSSSSSSSSAPSSLSLSSSSRDFSAVSATELEQFLAPKLASVGATLIVVSHQLSGLETLKEKYVLTYGPRTGSLL